MASGGSNNHTLMIGNVYAAPRIPFQKSLLEGMDVFKALC
jgi:hypothetical protein